MSKHLPLREAVLSWLEYADSLSPTPQSKHSSICQRTPVSTYSCDCSTEYGDICTSVRAGRSGHLAGMAGVGR